MKKLFYLLLGLSIQHLGFSQELQWYKSWAANANQIILSTTFDNQNNIYLAGISSADFDADPGPNTFTLTKTKTFMGFVIKLDTNGNFLTAFKINSTGNLSIDDIEVDNSGNIFISGIFTDTLEVPTATNFQSYGDSIGQGDNIYVAKLNPAGQTQWCNVYGSESQYQFYYDNIELTSQGDVILTGKYGPFFYVQGHPNSPFFGDDLFLMKLSSSNGNYVWIKFIKETNAAIKPSFLRVDANDNIFLAGQFNRTVQFENGLPTTTNYGNNYSYDPFIIKYDSSGSYIAHITYGYFNNEDISSFDVDNNGNLYIAGIYKDSIDVDPSANTNYLVCDSSGYGGYAIKLDNNLNLSWAINFNGRNNGIATMEGVVTDNLGNAYFMGFGSINTEFAGNIMTGFHNKILTKINATGNVEWMQSYTTQTGNLQSYKSKYLMYKNGFIYVPISYYLPTDSLDLDFSTNTVSVYGVSSVDCSFMKYNTIPVVNTGINSSIHLKENLIVYPNPAKEQFNVKLKNKTIKSISIYSVTGKLLITTNNTNIKTQNLSKGIYFLQITDSENKVYSEKIMIQ